MITEFALPKALNEEWIQWRKVLQNQTICRKIWEEEFLTIAVKTNENSDKNWSQESPTLLIKWFNGYKVILYVNPFSTNIPLLYPLKTSENVSRGYTSGKLVENG